jgi:hypothetical protein
LRLTLPRPSFASLRCSLRALPLRKAFVALGHERVIGISVAGIVLAASFLSVTPGRANGDTGAIGGRRIGRQQ